MTEPGGQPATNGHELLPVAASSPREMFGATRVTAPVMALPLSRAPPWMMSSPVAPPRQLPREAATFTVSRSTPAPEFDGIRAVMVSVIGSCPSV